jgi:hypothetical protein
MTSQNIDLSSLLTLYKLVTSNVLLVELLREPYEAHNTACAEMRNDVISEQALFPLRVKCFN